MKVLYVIGSSRCGSTVLGNVLGELPGFFAAGEIRFLWERAVQGRLCGCRSPVETCEIWGKVLSGVRGSGGPTPEEMLAADRAALRPHHLPALLMRRPGDVAGDPSFSRYANTLRDTYQALGELTGTKVIVDTSKRPTNGALSRLLPGIDVRYLHLVRDPRGVAHSQSRSKPNPDGAPTGRMATLSPARSCALWCATNIMGDALRWRAGRDRSMLLRYDDLVARPERSVQRIASFVGEEVPHQIFTDGRTIRIGTHHTVAGNADRFTTGDVTLRSDDRWLRHMSRRDRRVVELMAAPQIVRYGMSLIPPSPYARGEAGR